MVSCGKDWFRVVSAGFGSFRFLVTTFCKSIDLNFLQIYTDIGSARRHENQHVMLDALPWVNIFKVLELLNAILLSYLL